MAGAHPTTIPDLFCSQRQVALSGYTQAHRRSKLLVLPVLPHPWDEPTSMGIACFWGPALGGLGKPRRSRHPAAGQCAAFRLAPCAPLAGLHPAAGGDAGIPPDLWKGSSFSFIFPWFPNFLISFSHKDYRRKFRSQTSDNMDRWKSRGGKSQGGEEQEREDQRRERERRKKMQAQEKVRKSRFTLFFQWFVAPECRKVGSLKRRVRSQLAR